MLAKHQQKLWRKKPTRSILVKLNTLFLFKVCHIDGFVLLSTFLRKQTKTCKLYLLSINSLYFDRMLTKTMDDLAENLTKFLSWLLFEKAEKVGFLFPRTMKCSTTSIGNKKGRDIQRNSKYVKFLTEMKCGNRITDAEEVFYVVFVKNP